MADNVKDPEHGGDEAAGVRIFLQSCLPIGVCLRFRDVGGSHLYGIGHGGFPIPGGAVTDWED